MNWDLSFLNDISKGLEAILDAGVLAMGIAIVVGLYLWWRWS